MPATVTVRDIVVDALRELNILAAGEVASSDEAISGMAALNRLIDEWAAERLMIYTNTRTLWTILPNQQDYSVGPGGDVNIPYPMFVEHVNFINAAINPALEFQLTPLTNDAWARVPIKTLPAPMPTSFYWNATFPLGTLQLWPLQTLATLQGVMYAPEQAVEFTDLSTVIVLPPGYRRMLVKNLAMELLPSYQLQANPVLADQAADSKATVKRANITQMDLSVDPGALIGGRGSHFTYDIRVGP